MRSVLYCNGRSVCFSISSLALPSVDTAPVVSSFLLCKPVRVGHNGHDTRVIRTNLTFAPINVLRVTVKPLFPVVSRHFLPLAFYYSYRIPSSLSACISRAKPAWWLGCAVILLAAFFAMGVPFCIATPYPTICGWENKTGVTVLCVCICKAVRVWRVSREPNRPGGWGAKLSSWPRFLPWAFRSALLPRTPPSANEEKGSANTHLSAFVLGRTLA